MEVTKLLFLLLVLCTSAKPPHKRRQHTAKCNPPQNYGRDDSSSEEDNSNSGEDNEVAAISTLFPANYPPDPYLDTEMGDEVLPDPPKLVDFIVIKHRFSNATNMAFPPYVYGGNRKKGKKRSGIKSKNFERLSKHRDKKVTKSPPRRPDRSLGTRIGGRSRRPS